MAPRQGRRGHPSASTPDQQLQYEANLAQYDLPQTNFDPHTNYDLPADQYETQSAVDEAAAAANVIENMKQSDYQRQQESPVPEPKPSNPQSFTISDEEGIDISCQSRGADRAGPDSTILIFTHGAGGGIDNPATALFCEGYGELNPVTCFKGNMNLTSRVKYFETVLANLQAEEPRQSFAVGGRSMGARAAAKIAKNHDEVKKLVLASYPLISAKGDRREQTLLDLDETKQVLFIIGDRDNMCPLSDLRDVQRRMRAKSTLLIVENGDHEFNLTGLKGFEKIQAVQSQRKLAGTRAAEWILGVKTVYDGAHLVESGDTAEPSSKKRKKNPPLFYDQVYGNDDLGEAEPKPKAKRQKKGQNQV